MPILRTSTLGIAFCAMAAIFYTACNICMRQVSSLHCDPSWGVCLKESITVIVIGPYLIYRLMRGLPVFPPFKILVILIFAGLADQLLGNLGWQWAVGIVGLAVTVPVSFGIMIAASAVFGRMILGEKVTPRSMGAIGVLLVSLVLLSMGAESAGKAMAESAQASVANLALPATNALLVAEAVLVAGIAGAAYALLSIAIRHTMNADAQQGMLMFIITGIGVITLGPISVHRQGIEVLLATPWQQLAWVSAAGIFNLLGFIGLTKGLQLTTVVHANVLNASQVAMAALAGMFIFFEPPNGWILLGVGLTVLGIFLVDRPLADDAVDQVI
jgi:drug/metabolite transporter, DME family